MQNRSKHDIPAIYEHLKENWMMDIPDHRLNPQLITYLHFHSITEIGMCLSGEGVCVVDDTEFTYKAGDVQIIFPFQKHYHRTNAGCSSIWRWNNIITENILSYIGISDFSKIDERIRNDVSAYGILDSTKFPRTCEAIRHFIEADSPIPEKTKSSDPLVYERMALDYYNILLTLFEESSMYSKKPVSIGISKMYEIAPALKIIKEAISNGLDISIEELSAQCHCSVSNFRRKFQNAVGTSPKDYLTACRIRRAKNKLAHTKDDILSIAMSVGYHNVSGFNRAFLKSTGKTPSEYRKQNSVPKEAVLKEYNPLTVLPLKKDKK